MIRHLLTILSFLSLLALPLQAKNKNVEAQLATIDSLINNYPTIEARQMALAEKVKGDMVAQRSPQKRFALLRRIVSIYRQCNTDSALRYAGQMVAIAKRSDHADDLLMAQLDQASVLSGAGQLTEARQLMESIRPRTMTNAMKIEYYGQLYYLFSFYAVYNDKGGVNRDYYYQKEFAYADSALAIMKVDNPYYPLYKGWKCMRLGKYDEGIHIGENYLAFRPGDNLMKGDILYMMSVCCRMANYNDRQLDYLLDAAITNLRIGNSNNEVMGDLVTLLCRRGYISQAYNYTSFDMKMAMKLRNRVKLVKMQIPLDYVQRAYNDKLLGQRHNMQMLLTGIVLLALCLAFTLLYILRQQRRLARRRRDLQHSNHQLKESNQQLNNANEQLAAKVDELSAVQASLKEANQQLETLNLQLQEANARLGVKNTIKEEYIGFVLSLCSDYISKLDRYRKNINRKVKAHLYLELYDMTESQAMMQTELKAFYEHFDSVFLHVYPDFVSDFNRLLQPQSQLHTKEGCLNTELRIFALMRLGITDSQKIADFLHCSLQTVYNNRLRTRQKAIDRETFDKQLLRLE